MPTARHEKILITCVVCTIFLHLEEKRKSFKVYKNIRPQNFFSTFEFYYELRKYIVLAVFLVPYFWVAKSFLRPVAFYCRPSQLIWGTNEQFVSSKGPQYL